MRLAGGDDRRGSDAVSGKPRGDGGAMSSLERRLANVTTILQARGCPDCRHWDVTRVELVPAGVEPLPIELPETCPTCGRRPPDRTMVVRIFAPDDADDAGIGA